MSARISKFASFLALSSVLVFSSAYAGNGNGNGGGNGGGGNGGGSSSSHGNSDHASSESSSSNPGQTKKASVTTTSVASVGKGKLASKMGALNAAHASPNAFLHASANSRVGKIKAYYLANVESEAAKDALTTAESDNTAAQAALQTLIGGGYVAATNLVDANAALDDANAALLLAPDDVAAIQAVADAQTVVDAFEAAAALLTAQGNVDSTADATADALAAAANKPVDDPAIKEALDLLLVGKIATP